MSSFVGRRKELAEVRRLLGHTRLLTLVGPGGTGKTRLATEFVRGREARFPNPTVFVELGALTDGDRVVHAVARAAAVKLDDAEPLASLTRQLGERPSVVVLDNCEHLVAASAEVAARLLAECPGLVLIATSRERLNVEGEVAWTVPPLQVPQQGDDLAAASASDAVSLFVDRARAVRPGFALNQGNARAVLEICRRLDGIPLAIELAAARMTTLSPADLHRRLDRRLQLLTGGTRDQAPRQQTLRATIDWSYELLDLREQRLLQRMSIFAGSPTAAAIEEVCGAPPLDGPAMLDTLTRLVEKSVVQAAAGDAATRYRLLEAIREYGYEKLEAESLVDELRLRQLTRYRRLAAEAFEADKRRGPSAEHALLWQEVDDLRASLEGGLTAQPEAVLEIVANLFGFRLAYSPAEGRDRLGNALLLAGAASPDIRSLAAGFWMGLAGMTDWSGEWPIPQDELLAIIQAAEDPFVVANRSQGMGYMAQRQLGDSEAASRYLRAAIAGFEAVGATSYLAMSMGTLGQVEMQLGRLEQARTWIERAGMTSKVIAARLFLSERTVESHLDHVMTKLGVGSRAHCLPLAFDGGVVRGGRGGAGPPAGPVPPYRRPAQHPARAGQAGRAHPGRQLQHANAVRDPSTGALLLPGGGRPHGAPDPIGHHHRMRL